MDFLNIKELAESLPKISNDNIKVQTDGEFIKHSKNIYILNGKYKGKIALIEKVYPVNYLGFYKKEYLVPESVFDVVSMNELKKAKEGDEVITNIGVVIMNKGLERIPELYEINSFESDTKFVSSKDKIAEIIMVEDENDIKVQIIRNGVLYDVKDNLGSIMKMKKREAGFEVTAELLNEKKQKIINETGVVPKDEDVLKKIYEDGLNMLRMNRPITKNFPSSKSDLKNPDDPIQMLSKISEMLKKGEKIENMIVESVIGKTNEIGNYYMVIEEIYLPNNVRIKVGEWGTGKKIEKRMLVILKEMMRINKKEAKLIYENKKPVYILPTKGLYASKRYNGIKFYYNKKSAGVTAKIRLENGERIDSFEMSRLEDGKLISNVLYLDVVDKKTKNPLEVIEKTSNGILVKDVRGDKSIVSIKDIDLITGFSFEEKQWSDEVEEEDIMGEFITENKEDNEDKEDEKSENDEFDYKEDDENEKTEGDNSGEGEGKVGFKDIERSGFVERRLNTEEQSIKRNIIKIVESNNINSDYINLYEVLDVVKSVFKEYDSTYKTVVSNLEEGKIIIACIVFYEIIKQGYLEINREFKFSDFQRNIFFINPNTSKMGKKPSAYFSMGEVDKIMRRRSKLMELKVDGLIDSKIIKKNYNNSQQYNVFKNLMTNASLYVKEVLGISFTADSVNNRSREVEQIKPIKRIEEKEYAYPVSKLIDSVTNEVLDINDKRVPTTKLYYWGDQRVYNSIIDDIKIEYNKEGNQYNKNIIKFVLNSFEDAVNVMRKLEKDDIKYKYMFNVYKKYLTRLAEFKRIIKESESDDKSERVKEANRIEETRKRIRELKDLGEDVDIEDYESRIKDENNDLNNKIREMRKKVKKDNNTDFDKVDEIIKRYKSIIDVSNQDPDSVTDMLLDEY